VGAHSAPQTPKWNKGVLLLREGEGSREREGERGRNGKREEGRG